MTASALDTVVETEEEEEGEQQGAGDQGESEEGMAEVKSQAELLKEAGNAALKAGQVERAVKLYSDAIVACEEAANDLGHNGGGGAAAAAAALPRLRAVCLTNRGVARCARSPSLCDASEVHFS
jgi:hypothetical protein